jgi:hypothetical protein
MLKFLVIAFSLSSFKENQSCENAHHLRYEVLINPTELFGERKIIKSAKFLLPLINRRGHPELIQVAIALCIRELPTYHYQ